AQAGDEDAAGRLAGIGREFVDASLNSASTLQQYRRDVAMVRQAVDATVAGLDEQIDYQEAQLDALKESVKGQIEIRDELKTNNDLVGQLLREIKGMRGEQKEI